MIRRTKALNGPIPDVTSYTEAVSNTVRRDVRAVLDQFMTRLGLVDCGHVQNSRTPATGGNMVKNALVRALTRVLVLVFAPKTSRTVPIKEIVGERARRSGSGSPFSLLVLFQ